MINVLTYATCALPYRRSSYVTSTPDPRLSRARYAIVKVRLVALTPTW
nr:MAG TPA: hypothetical protein [Caudoviricetes sp.]